MEFALFSVFLYHNHKHWTWLSQPSPSPLTPIPLVFEKGILVGNPTSRRPWNMATFIVGSHATGGLPPFLPSFRRAALYCHFTFWRQASRKKSATWHAGLSNNFTAIWIYYPNRWQKCQKSLWVEGIGRTPGGEPNRCNKAIFCLPWRPWRRHKKLGILLLLFKVGTTNSQRKKPWINLSTFFNFFLKRCF